jgi:sporulation protein YlmC with PRC-barrel domain
MYGRELSELEIVDSSGWKIGKVKDVIIDRNTWRVTALDIELEKSIAKEFQMKHRLSSTRVPVSIAYIQAIGDSVVLKASKEEVLQQALAESASSSSSEQKKP